MPLERCGLEHTLELHDSNTWALKLTLGPKTFFVPLSDGLELFLAECNVISAR
jgi:hypothetical protein